MSDTKIELIANSHVSTAQKDKYNPISKDKKIPFLIFQILYMY